MVAKNRFITESLHLGTMVATGGLFVLFVLGTSWACDARELMTTELSSRETVISDVSVLQINHQESEGIIKASEEVGRNENVCTLCEEFAAKAIEYLEDNKTQTEIIDILHNTYARLIPFEQKCITLVDYYVTLLFSEIELLQPEDFCQAFYLCEQRVLASQSLAEDKCEICHLAISEVIVKLKDPDTQLEIIELLLKACDAVENYVKKCKTLVFEYGPFILENAEQFLESTDICTLIHACPSTSTGGEQALSQ
ncbi:prosaposin-like isoform X1 [Camellia sinensis]|uniref:prosaposin-like isoform X1 n=1 Tax=Camellia sinensis TaxID=4442 RepID=UPI0010358227|nr:prosaposin-like isoform X1 [Camellia sinensis]